MARSLIKGLGTGIPLRHGFSLSSLVLNSLFLLHFLTITRYGVLNKCNGYLVVILFGKFVLVLAGFLYLF